MAVLSTQLAAQPGTSSAGVYSRGKAAAASRLGVRMVGPAPRVGTWIKCLPTIWEEHGDRAAIKGKARAPLELDGATVTDPRALREASCADLMVARLEEGPAPQRRLVLAFLRGLVKPLALSRHGCRIVQKALEVASTADRDAFISELRPHFGELYRSRYGNHVLTKLIEVTPNASLGFLIAEITGRCAALARHPYGCRILERLFEHCADEQVAGLVAEIEADAVDLCRHQFGNFAVQRLLEYAAPQRRAALLGRMLPEMAVLAMDRVGRSVVQRALDYGTAPEQQAVLGALTSGLGGMPFEEVVCSEYGSMVVEELADSRDLCGLVLQALAPHLARLAACEIGSRVAERFGLLSAVRPAELGGPEHFEAEDAAPLQDGPRCCTGAAADDEAELPAAGSA